MEKPEEIYKENLSTDEILNILDIFEVFPDTSEDPLAENPRLKNPAIVQFVHDAVENVLSGSIPLEIEEGDTKAYLTGLRDCCCIILGHKMREQPLNYLFDMIKKITENERGWSPSYANIYLKHMK